MQPIQIMQGWTIAIHEIELLRVARNDVICPINGISRLLFADDEGQYVDIDNNTTLPSLHVYYTQA